MIILNITGKGTSKQIAKKYAATNMYLQVRNISEDRINTIRSNDNVYEYGKNDKTPFEFLLNNSGNHLQDQKTIFSFNTEKRLEEFFNQLNLHGAQINEHKVIQLILM